MFIRAEQSDIFGLIEVDTGSVRTGMVNQAEHIASQIGHYSTYECKYGRSSLTNSFPLCASRRMLFCPRRTCRRALPLLRHRHQAAYY